MTREEAKKAAEVMLAYANGKDLQIGEQGGNEWVDVTIPVFNWELNSYRIKSEPKYRPFKTGGECWEEMKKHELFGWLKSKSGDYKVINSVNFASINSNDYYYTYKQAFDDFTFIDGTPFGIKED